MRNWLQALEQKLTLLDQVLAQQNPELTTLQLQLTESRRELETLRNELSMSKKQLTKAEESLRNANLFLEKCAAEEKKTRLKIKAQRNTWAAVATCLVVALAVK
jgi:septal ring factor EnvC (AmiA/AmiB activator)